jgi:hypothetical protein
VKNPSQSQKPKVKTKGKKPLFLLQGSFITVVNRVEQGLSRRGMTLQQEKPAFLLF